MAMTDSFAGACNGQERKFSKPKKKRKKIEGIEPTSGCQQDGCNTTEPRQSRGRRLRTFNGICRRFYYWNNENRGFARQEPYKS
eukprot:2689865-Prymnesium_polylepis.1